MAPVPWYWCGAGGMDSQVISPRPVGSGGRNGGVGSAGIRRLAARRALRHRLVAMRYSQVRTELIMYDTETVPVPSAPGAECVTVTAGKITYSRFVFDRAPFDAARKAAT